MFDHKMFYQAYGAQIVKVVRKAALAELNVSAEEFNQHLQHVTNTIEKELTELLPKAFNLEYFKKYMRFSGRSYLILNTSKKTVKRKGDKQLDRFIEEIATQTFDDSSNSIATRNFIKQTIKMNNEKIPADEDNEIKSTKMIEEIIHFIAKQAVLSLGDQLAIRKNNKKTLKVGFDDKSYTRIDSLQIPQLLYQLNLMCELYVKKQFATLQELKSQLGDRCELIHHEDDEIQQLEIDPIIKLPAKIVFKYNNASPSDDKMSLIEKKLGDVTKQYNRMQELRVILNNKHTQKVEKFETFREQYLKSEELLNKDIDNTLKKVLNAIKNILRSGIRGTLMFWKSETDLVKNMLTSCKVGTYKVATKTQATHKVLTRITR